MVIIPEHGLLTVDDYYKLVDDGILSEYDRVELIEGRIVEMAPIGDDHIASTIDLTGLFVTRLWGLADVSVQSPVNLARRSEPEPDFTIVRPVPGGRRKSRARKPTPADVFLIIEVANSSLSFDLGVKAALYARYGINEFWVIDIPHDRLVVHREPTADGYASIETVPRGTTLSLLAFPDIPFTADEILG